MVYISFNAHSDIWKNSSYYLIQFVLCITLSIKNCTTLCYTINLTYKIMQYYVFNV